MNPDYGLPTRSTDPDGKVTTTGYTNPAVGLPTSTSQDPTGLNLVTSTGYEAVGSGWLRRLTKTMPSSAVSVTDAFYGDNEARTNPCPGGTSATQAGLVKTSTGADPDGGGPQQAVQSEVVRDAAGQEVAVRRGTTGGIGSEPWICTSFDARGRPTSVSYPAWGGQPARTVTYNYKVGNDPRVSSVGDAAGTITIAVNGIGQVTAYTDVWGKTTSTVYDQVGRVVSVSSPLGNRTYTYTASNGRLVSTTLDGSTMATVGYDTAGRMSTVAFPSGTGNGTDGTFGFDPNSGRQSTLTWKRTGGANLYANTYARTLAGRVRDETIDGVDPYAGGDNFTYDGAGRLLNYATTGATGGYDYGTYTGGQQSAGCSLGAVPSGRNTNRVSRDSGSVTYCYDHADRLVSTNEAGYTGTISYDAHGNTTIVAGETHVYDIADRHQQTTKGATTVTYTRDATDRIVARNEGGTVTRYSYTVTGDTGDATLDSAGNLIEKTVPLPGGVLLTTRSGGNVWSYPNLHGDIAAVANQTGVKQGGSVTYRPYGEPATGSLPDNSNGNLDYGWAGQHQRPIEHGSGLQPVTEMGARPYSSTLGRFLETDPIEGGTPNDYAYPDDPVSQFDLDGRCGFGNPFKRCGPDHRGGTNIVSGALSRGRGAAVRAGRAARWVYRHVDLNAGFCVVLCLGIGFQGGRTYWSHGLGIAVAAGVGGGFATRPYAKRECSSLTITAGPAYVQQGIDGRGGLNTRDWEFGGTYGLGGGLYRSWYHGSGC